MIFGSKHQDTAKLGAQRITVKSSEVSKLPLSVESSIPPHTQFQITNYFPRNSVLNLINLIIVIVSMHLILHTYLNKFQCTFHKCGFIQRLPPNRTEFHTKLTALIILSVKSF